MRRRQPVVPVPAAPSLTPPAALLDHLDMTWWNEALWRRWCRSEFGDEVVLGPLHDRSPYNRYNTAAQRWALLAGCGSGDPMEPIDWSRLAPAGVRLFPTRFRLRTREMCLAIRQRAVAG